MLKAIFVFELYTFFVLFRAIYIFGYSEKQLHKKGKVNFKIYDVTGWTTNNCNAHIAQYLKK